MWYVINGRYIIMIRMTGKLKNTMKKSISLKNTIPFKTINARVQYDAFITSGKSRKHCRPS